MKKDEKIGQQTINNNWNFGETFKYINFRWILKWFLWFIVITGIVGVLGAEVEVDTSFNCNSGDFGLEYSDKGMNRTSIEEIKIDGIKNMRCTGNVKLKAPLILAIFT